MVKKFLALALSLLMVLALVAGCNTGTSDTSTVPSSAPSTAPSKAPDNTGNDDDPVVDPADPHDLLQDNPDSVSADHLGGLAFKYEIAPLNLPLTEKTETFTFWIESPNPTANMLNLADGDMWQELERRTNIHVEMDHPAKGMEREQFMLVVNSGDLPEMMKNPEFYPGGFDKAMDDEIFIDMAEYMEWMPHYSAMVNSSESVRRSVYTDTGRIGLIHFFQYLEDGKKQKVNYGMAVREDLMIKNGWNKDLPETFDELEELLTFFKDEAGFPNGPFPMSPNGVFGFSFMNGFFVNGGWRIDTNTNKVEYSPIQEEFRQYVTLLNDWFNKGLIYRDFLSISGELGSQGELWHGRLPIGVTFAIFAGDTQHINGTNPDPDYNIVGIKNPVFEKGTKPMPSAYSIEDTTANAYMAFAITTACHNKPLLCRWWDYFFSSEGALLINYGNIEGDGPDDWETTYYRGADGRPILTNFIMRNPEFGSSEMMQQYIWHGCILGLYNREVDTETESQLATHYRWSDQDFDSRYRPIPAAYVFLPDESTVYNAKYNDLQTYMQENTLKFIMGDRPLSEFDNFVSEVNGMGVEDVRAVVQSAVDRYFQR